MTNTELCNIAIKAMERAYVPYSHYRVGAALLTASGKVYSGCNIENASFTPTVCAERTAFFKAISDGETEFSAIAVAGGKDGKIEGVFQPCGVCRQVMAEFCSPDFIIFMVEPDGKYSQVTLNDLLPNAFTPKNLKNI